MSTDSVENIHLRLREEIERCGFKLAEASRAIGDASPQSLKDVVAGRKKCPAELVGRLSVLGVDIFYVLTGQQTARSLSKEERTLLDNYRHLGKEQKEALAHVSKAMTAGYQADKTSEG